LGKYTRLPFRLSNSISNEPFALVYSNVWGPAPIDSYNGYKYFIIFIDDYFKTTWLYLMKNKNEVLSHFQEIYNFVENQYNYKTKFSYLFKIKGHLTPNYVCIYSPTKWYFGKKKNRYLLEMTCVLLFQNNVPKIYWPDTVLAATYLINRLPSLNLNYKSPLEILYKKKS
jgi:hypothetical protein